MDYPKVIKMLPLTKDAIDNIFAEESKHTVVKPFQGNIISKLYNLALELSPEDKWENISKIEPSKIVVNKPTSLYIFEKFFNFDRLYHPDVMRGGAWMNSGFGTHDEMNLSNWEVAILEGAVEYKEKTNEGI